MTPKEFTTFLESPESNDFSIEQLEKLLKQYPYTQSLRIAFLRKLKASNHPDFEKHLHTTSTYTFDRAFLRKYINNENIYVVGYPAIKVETEPLETLDLLPLKDLEPEINEHFLDLESTDSAQNSLMLPSDNWDNVFNENNFNDDLSVSLGIDSIEDSEENDLNENQNIELDSAEYLEENDLNENQNIELDSAAHLEEINHQSAITNHKKIETDSTEHSEEINHESLIIPELLEQANHEIKDEMKNQKELQKLILDSKKRAYHAPIEEDIDNLLAEDELEGLDDEIEFGFEIDKVIISDEDDMSLFDGHPGQHNKHHNKEHHEAEKHDEKEHHGEEKPLHEVIHEKINDETTVESTADKPIKAAEETEKEYELSPSSIFQKQERSLFSLDNRADYIDNEEELPLEEETDTTTTENVEQIRAALSNSHQNKQAKKEHIKKYLQRIAQIPSEENGIISETYAALLAKQGKIERSIRMYQQLILKNPQKKVYFAAKIKQLIKNI
jgi:hypothetical protein